MSLTDVADPAAATAPTSSLAHPSGKDCAEAVLAEMASARHEATNERTDTLVTGNLPWPFEMNCGDGHRRGETAGSDTAVRAKWVPPRALRAAVTIPKKSARSRY